GLLDPDRADHPSQHGRCRRVSAAHQPSWSFIREPLTLYLSRRTAKSLVRISTATGFLAAIALGWSSLAAPAHADWAEDFEDYSIDQVLNGVGGWARSGAVADKVQQNAADPVNPSKTWNLT